MPFSAKSSALGVDCNERIVWQRAAFDLRDPSKLLHVGRIASRADDTPDFDLGVAVGRCNKGPRCVIDQRYDIDWQVLVQSAASICLCRGSANKPFCPKPLGVEGRRHIQPRRGY
jgi:hypothetical protein